MKLWKFKYLLLLLCLLSYGALAADRSIATITPSSKYCRLVFHNSPEDVRHHYLQQGSDYIVVYADELIPFKGKLVNTTRTDDGLFIHHFELPDGQVKEIANAEIASVAQLKGSGKPLIELPTAEGVNWGGRLKQAQGILGLYLKPFAPLARRGNIEVVGNLISSRKLAREVAEFVEEVDSHLVKFGLNPPDQTRIIINDRPIFEDVLGPAAVTVPVYNVWSREKKNLIHLGAWGKNTELLKNPSVIAHERVHSHFHVTHTKDAFVLKNQSIQEAFADFMAAHTLNDPRIAFDTIFPGVAMRDIQTRSFV